MNVQFLKDNCMFHTSSKNRILKSLQTFVRISLDCNQNGRSLYSSFKMLSEDHNLFSIKTTEDPHLKLALFLFFLELFLQVIIISMYCEQGEIQWP